jgi:hypothetical protein
MRAYASLSVLLATCGLIAVPQTADACGRRRVSYCVTPVYCPPCPPHPICCPPDESPLHPLPAHPVPHTTLAHALTLKNDAPTQSFVVIYIRHPDCVYRVYDKQLVQPNTSVPLNPQRYFAGDHLLIETWTRHHPHHAWHCHCKCLVTLTGASGTFDLSKCSYTHP